MFTGNSSLSLDGNCFKTPSQSLTKITDYIFTESLILFAPERESEGLDIVKVHRWF